MRSECRPVEPDATTPHGKADGESSDSDVCCPLLPAAAVRCAWQQADEFASARGP